MPNSTRNMIATFPARLAELRQLRGLSQQALADLAGASVSGLWALERGERAPSLELAGRIADALGVPVDALRQPAGSPVRRAPKKNPENLSE